MTNELSLLPYPRELKLENEWVHLGQGTALVIDGQQPTELLFSAKKVLTAVQDYCGLSWELVVGSTVPANQIACSITVIPGAVTHEQGYRLIVNAAGISISAGTTQGAFYGVCTLIQLLKQFGSHLPLLRINDWPDFPQRGVMLDISRDKVPTMDTLYQLVDLLASWKINQLQLYTEHTFAYRRHPVVWEEASPMTGQEILELDAYCRERFMQLVPNQNSFGHMARWLKHDAYKDLAECPGGFQAPWGRFEESMTLWPGNAGSLQLVKSLFDELLSHFQSPYFNIGCDETFELGIGRSAEVVKEQGVGPVYLDFLLSLYREVKARGRVMQFWGDIIIQHPELVPQLPRDIIALEWGYEADHPFSDHGALFNQAGIPFYVCPGTSSWNSIAGRTENALQNQLNAARNGLKNGAVGYLNTDWGDNGHWQPLPVSYLGFASGASLSWCLAANEARSLDAPMSLFAFADPAGELGEIVRELGDVYHETKAYLPNGTVLFWLLQTRPDDLRLLRKQLLSGSIAVENLKHTEELLQHIFGRLGALTSDDTERSLVIRELRWVASILAHSCRRGIWMLWREVGDEDQMLRRQLAAEAVLLMDEFREIWHARYRPGGFQDSMQRMKDMQADYGPVD